MITLHWRMPNEPQYGEPFRLSSLSRHHVNVCVSSILSAEGYRPAVIRKMRMALSSDVAGQPVSCAPASRRDPDVVGVHKRDLRL